MPKRPDYTGSVCTSCDRVIRPGEFTWGGGGWPFHVRADGIEHAFIPTTDADSTSRPARPPRDGGERRAGRRGGRRRRRGGGRPLAFIPTLVVAHAAELAGRGRSWADVLRALETGGNGTYARNTLIRRVQRYRLEQQPEPLETPPRRRPARAGASRRRGHSSR